MDQRLQNSERNKHAVLSSAIVAKAVVQLNADALRGRINIIVVFQKSTRHEFYWVFQARSARSARKSWKYVCHYGRDFNMANDFGSFAAYYAAIKHAEVRTVRVLHVRRLAALLTKTEFESIHSDWTPRDEVKLVSYAGFESNNRSVNGQSKGFYFNRRDRSFDEPSQSPNEVLVYEDDCEECNTRHSYAHFHDGKKTCKLGFTEMKKNPGFEYRGFNNATGFRFTYRSAIGAGA